MQGWMCLNISFSTDAVIDVMCDGLKEISLYFVLNEMFAPARGLRGR